METDEVVVSDDNNEPLVEIDEVIVSGSSDAFENENETAVENRDD